MDALGTSSVAHQRNDARLEELIEKLIGSESNLSEQLIQEHSQLNRQQLNQLIRNTSRSEKTTAENNDTEPTKALPASPARKKLKHYLKEHLYGVLKL